MARVAAMASSSSGKRSYEEIVEELRQNLTPEEYQRRLEEQVSLAMACEAPEMSGFKFRGEKNEYIDQQRKLNIYKTKLKTEIEDALEGEGGSEAGLARPVVPAVEAEATSPLEGGGEGPEGGVVATGSRKQKRKRKRQKPEEDKGELQDEAQEAEAQDEAQAEATKRKRKKKKESKKASKKLPDDEQGDERAQAYVGLLKPNTHTEMLEIGESEDEKNQCDEGLKVVEENDEAKNVQEKQNEEKQQDEEKSDIDEKQNREKQEEVEEDAGKIEAEGKAEEKPEDDETKQENQEKDDQEDERKTNEIKETTEAEEKPEDNEDFEEEEGLEDDEEEDLTEEDHEVTGPGSLDANHDPTPPSLPLQPRPPTYAPPAAWKGKKGKNYEKGKGGKARGKGKGKNKKGAKGYSKGKPGSHGYYVWDGFGNQGFVDSWGELQPFLVSYCCLNL